MQKVGIWVISGLALLGMIAVLAFSAPDPVTELAEATGTPEPVAEIDPSATQSTDFATPTSQPPAPATPTETLPDPTPEPTATEEAVADPTVEPVPVQDEPDAAEEFAAKEVVIKLVPGSDLAALAADHQLDPAPLGQFGSREIYRMQIIDGATPVERSEALQADGRVEFAEPNYIVRSPEWRSRYSWAKFDEVGENIGDWPAETMRLAEAHAVSTGAGVTVAVLDTGVDASHPDLAGKVGPGFDFVDLDNDPSEVGAYTEETPAYGHGTHVAGSVVRVAPSATIMPIRVLDPQGQGNIWVLAEAINYAVDPDGNPATPDGAHVINLSLGTLRRTNLLDQIIREVACYDVPSFDDDDDDDWDDDDWDDDDWDADDCDDDDWDDDDWDDDDWDDEDDDDWDDDDDDDDDDDRGSSSGVKTVLATSHRTGNYQIETDPTGCGAETGHGIVVVAAAGNSGTDTPEYPAAEPFSGVLSVGASTSADLLADASSFGAWVDVAAPGKDILSAMPENDYAAWSGTSMASAHAAGQAALVRALYPDMSAFQVIERIRATASIIPGEVPLRIDAAASVTEPR